MDKLGEAVGPTQRVSVVIPAYRAAGTIRRAIDSVLAQTHPAAEIIVVDDGSPDDQASVVERCYGSKVTLIRKDNGGTASARNAGLDRADGDYVAFLDADDYWEDRKLSVQLEHLNRFPELGLLAGTYYEETPGRPRSSHPVRPGPASCYDRVLRLDGPRAFHLATLVWTSTVLVKREAVAGERFLSGLEPAEDRDMWVRLVSRWPSYVMSAPLGTAVLVQGSLSRSSIDRDKANMLRVVDRHRGLLGPISHRMWRSHTLYRWAAVDRSLKTAMPRLLRSLAIWPLPYARHVEPLTLGRLRRLAVLLADSVGARSTMER